MWNAITAGMGIKGKEQKAPLNDPRSPEEILADELPATDEPDATEKTAIRFAAVRNISAMTPNVVTAYYMIITMECILCEAAVGHRPSCLAPLAGWQCVPPGTFLHFVCFCLWVSVNLVIKLQRFKAEPLHSFCGEHNLLSDI